MSDVTLGLLAFLPIGLSALLLLGLQWPARKAMPAVLAATALLALLVWDMSGQRVAASIIQGLIVTVSVLWIVFGAIFLLNTLKYTGAIQTIRQ